eukprot:8566498-Lingulodinium_polyedra.AAC.1
MPSHAVDGPQELVKIAVTFASMCHVPSPWFRWPRIWSRSGTWPARPGGRSWPRPWPKPEQRPRQ